MRGLAVPVLAPRDYVLLAATAIVALTLVAFMAWLSLPTGP
jgi:hypothetical protein